MKRISSVLGLLIVLAAIVSGQDNNQASPSLLEASFGKLPIYFIENRGICPDEVKYYIQGADKTLFFTRDGITFRLKGQDRGWVVKLEFVGANKVSPEGQSQQQATFSYFKGKEADWKTGLPTFAKVVYEDLWPGVDLVYKGTVNQLKYEFVVHPGADPGLIGLRYRGAANLSLTRAGGLRVETPEGSFEDAAPFAYQEVDGKRVPVEMAFDLDRKSEGPGDFGFRLGRFDRSRPLILDPAVLVYCGYIGGTDDDYNNDISVDAAGNAYVTGYTNSDEKSFPVKVGPDLTYNSGQSDAFVAKVNALGTGLVYCGYIGGSASDEGNGIAVDGTGKAYVAGTTSSDEKSFPVKVGPDMTHNGGSSLPCDAFVAKVNAAGTGLVYCGYIGGSCDDFGHDISVDAAGNAYVTGNTISTETSFPVKVGPDLTFNGNWDAFVAKVSAQGTGLVYCGYIGGTCDDHGNGISVDVAGNAYVTGWTCSDEIVFPVKVGPDLTYNKGFGDAILAKVNAAGTGLVYCGYIGGAGGDSGNDISVDAAGNAYVTGWTDSNEKSFPVKVGPDLTYNGNKDAFVAKVNAQGTGLVYCGYIGGSGDEEGSGIAVDGAGNAYVAGWTWSDEKSFPVKVGPDLTHNGGLNWPPHMYPLDAFVAKVNAQSTGLVYCGYIGGSGDEEGGGIAVDGAGNAYVAGWTWSDEKSFPVKVGPDLTVNGNWDAFVAKVALLDDLTASGTPRPGGIITLNLVAVEVRGIPYQLGSSLGKGPIQIDTRMLGLSPDDLLIVSVMGYLPSVFSGYSGVIDSKGQAKAAIYIPNDTRLIGQKIHTAFVTLSPSSPSGIKSISGTFSFSITK